MLSTYDVEKALALCARVKTVFVLKTVALAKPYGARVETAPDGDAGAGATAGARVESGATVSESACRGPGVRCRFVGGYVKVEVHVYKLDPFAHKGVFVVEAENAASPRITGTGADATLEADLTQQLGLSFVEALGRRFPGARTQGIP